MSVIIRPIQEEDWEDWVRLMDLFYQFYNMTRTTEIKKTTFERFLNGSIPMWSVVAVNVDTDKVIGFANYVEHYSTSSIEKKIFLDDLYVDETSRLGGVGRKLIEFVYKKADELGAPQVYWTTDLTNHRAQLLYSKLATSKFKALYQRYK